MTLVYLNTRGAANSERRARTKGNFFDVQKPEARTRAASGYHPSPATEHSSASDRSARVLGYTQPRKASSGRYHPDNRPLSDWATRSSSCGQWSARNSTIRAGEVYRRPVACSGRDVAPINEAQRIAKIVAVVDVGERAAPALACPDRDIHAEHSAF